MNESMTVESYGISDMGLVRKNNEDAFLILEDQQCFILADGMGGHNAGEIASHEAVHFLSDCMKTISKKDSSTQIAAHLLQYIKKTNEHVHVLSVRNPHWQGMGTTLCLALIHKDKLIYAHVGDSRIYRIRNGSISRLTQDHSLKDELMAKGELDESLTYLYKNVITRAIGTHANVVPDIKTAPYEAGDIYILCSDGLTDSLTDEEIASIILSSPSIKGAAEELVAEANLCGGNDNITIVLFKIA